MKSYLLKVYYMLLKVIEHFIILYNNVIQKVIKPPIVHSTDKTLDLIVGKDVSVSRFGDGEFAIMNGKSLLFQPYSDELGKKLREIITSNEEKHIVCIPNVFESVDWCTEKSKNYWIKYLNLNRNKIYRMIDMKKEYYDSLVSRLYIDHRYKSNAGKRFLKIRRLWDNKGIVIVEGEYSRLGVGNDLFGNTSSIMRIICPSINAFAKYDEILNQIKKYEKSKLILIALGPTATVLSFDLAKCGYQAIDIGHIDIEYEWFLQKAKEKLPVNNKYIGEIPDGADVSDIKDSSYEGQVITKIV